MGELRLSAVGEGEGDARSRLAPAYEATAARWIAPRLLPRRGEGRPPVGSVVPVGCETYVRIDHPEPEGDEGSLPASQAETLVGILRAHTTIPEQCRFALWEGWADLDAEARWPGAVRLAHPGRRYVLLRGPVEAAATSFTVGPGWRSPNLWWPLDRAWCVATDIDLAATYLGASAACAAEVGEELGAEAVDVGDPIA